MSDTCDVCNDSPAEKDSQYCADCNMERLQKDECTLTEEEILRMSEPRPCRDCGEITTDVLCKPCYVWYDETFGDHTEEDAKFYRALSDDLALHNYELQRDYNLLEEDNNKLREIFKQDVVRELDENTALLKENGALKSENRRLKKEIQGLQYDIAIGRARHPLFPNLRPPGMSGEHNG